MTLNPPVSQLKELILRLIIGPRITDSRDTKLGILDAIVLCATLTKGPSVRSNNGGVAKVCVHAVKARGIGNCNIDLIAPCHCFRYLYLLLFGRIHVALRSYNEFRAAHSTVTPNLGIISLRK